MNTDDIVSYVMETPGNTNPRILGEMVDNLGGAVLPEVTAEDNGDVLTVVDGAWAKASPSGGVMVVTATATLEEEEFVVTVDKTISEIVDAAKSMYVLCRLSEGEALSILPLTISESEAASPLISVEFGVADTLTTGTKVLVGVNDGITDVWTYNLD